MGTSFYGGGCVMIGGSGGGTSDYTDLINVPVKVLNGTSVQPIVFSELDYGNYHFSGYYKHNQNSTIYIESTPTNVQVFQDDVTLKKIVRLEYFENSEYYMVAFIYEEDGSYIEKKFSFCADPSSDVNTEAIEQAKDEAIAEAVLRSTEYVEGRMTLNIL